MIKAFLFDWGGVMSGGGRGAELSERLGQNLGIAADEAWELVRPSWHDFVRGKSTEAQFWAEVEANYGQPIALEHRNIWNLWKDTSVIPEMSILAARLRSAGLKVGLVSNVIPITANEIRSHGGYAGFEFCVLSYEVGFAKPDPEIYKEALAHVPDIKPEEVVFVDDIERCLVVPNELGMHTILAKSSEQVIADIQEILNKQTM